MKFDLLLPSTLFLISSAGLLLFSKLEDKLEAISSKERLRVRDVVLIVLVMGVMVTIMVVMPERIMQVLLLFSSSSLLFLLTHLIVPKWPLALLTPLAFLLSYFLYWNLILMDLFAVLFVVSAILYISVFFTWKTTLAFAGLLTAMDVIQVFGTRHMVAAAEKMSGLRLPILVVVPMYPSSGYVALGLGDLLLSGLLAIQTTRRWNRRKGLTCCALTAATLMTGEVIALNTTHHFLPATLFISLGWLITLGPTLLIKGSTPKSP